MSLIVSRDSEYVEKINTSRRGVKKKPLICEEIKGFSVPGAGIEPAQPLLATGF